MLCYFLLTYTVSDVGETSRSEDLANEVRRDIRKISEWDLVENQETTFKGVIKVSNEKHEREDDAKEKVTEEIKKILINRNAHQRHVRVYCTMMLEDTWGSFDFEVSV